MSVFSKASMIPLFSFVALLRILLAIATSQSWPLFQMDVKSVCFFMEIFKKYTCDFLLALQVTSTFLKKVLLIAYTITLWPETSSTRTDPDGSFQIQKVLHASFHMNDLVSHIFSGTGSAQTQRRALH